MNKLLEPSLLAFKDDYLDNLDSLKALGIKQIHFDIMDGELVSQKTPFTSNDLHLLLNKGFDVSVHYMGFDCLKEAQTYAQYPIRAMTFQFEALKLQPHLHSTLKAAFDVLHTHHIKCGIAFNPTTNFNEVLPWIKQSDIVTIMSVPAGAGGQTFDAASLVNLAAVYQYQQTINPYLIIQIDGGVKLDNLDQYLDKVQWVVSGSSFYHGNDKDKKLMIKKIQGN